MSGPGLQVAGLRSQAELSTGPTGGRGIGWMTGTSQSTDDKGWDATNQWCRDGRGVRDGILVCCLQT
eukprot:3335127-Rhodomonas_salina.1